MKENHIQQAGFSLIEMMVAVGLFAVVMVICVGTLFALVNANRKAQALQTVMNNLNITLDGMARSIRQGSHYHCGNTSDMTTTRDCGDGTSGNPPDTYFQFEHYGGNTSDNCDQWTYSFSGGRIYKTVPYDPNCAVSHDTNPPVTYALTSPEITIDSMAFYVTGTTEGVPDTANLQPRVIIVVKGTAAANNNKTRTSFHLQVGATQRLIDI